MSKLCLIFVLNVSKLSLNNSKYVSFMLNSENILTRGLVKMWFISHPHYCYGPHNHVKLRGVCSSGVRPARATHSCSVPRMTPMVYMLGLLILYMLVPGRQSSLIVLGVKPSFRVCCRSPWCRSAAALGLGHEPVLHGSVNCVIKWFSCLSNISFNALLQVQNFTSDQAYSCLQPSKRNTGDNDDIR
jgi:hypothetical protein